jgi:hypothetical protein
MGYLFVQLAEAMRRRFNSKHLPGSFAANALRLLVDDGSVVPVPADTEEEVDADPKPDTGWPADRCEPQSTLHANNSLVRLHRVRGALSHLSSPHPHPLAVLPWPSTTHALAWRCPIQLRGTRSHSVRLSRCGLLHPRASCGLQSC